MFGAHGEIRTPDRLVRSQVLYPAELHARKSFSKSFSNINRPNHVRSTLLAAGASIKLSYMRINLSSGVD